VLRTAAILKSFPVRNPIKTCKSLQKWEKMDEKCTKA